jgi:archaellum biogenesis ATPase FlaH
MSIFYSSFILIANFDLELKSLTEKSKVILKILNNRKFNTAKGIRSFSICTRILKFRYQFLLLNIEARKMS